MTKRQHAPQTSDVQTNAFLREVDDAMHEDRMKELWNEYKYLLIGGLISVFVVFAGIRYYNEVREDSDIEEAKLYIRSLQTPVNYEELARLAEQGSSGYALLAKFYLATHGINIGNTMAANMMYVGITEDNRNAKIYRDLANLYNAKMLTEENQYNLAKTILAGLSDKGLPFRDSSIEWLGYISEKEERPELAKQFYAYAVDNPQTTPGIMERIKARVEVLNR